MLYILNFELSNNNLLSIYKIFGNSFHFKTSNENGVSLIKAFSLKLDSLGV